MTRRSSALFPIVAILGIVLHTTSRQLAAQDIGSMRLKTPGTAFAPAIRGITVDDVPEGRRFRGSPGALIRIWARLRIPPSSAGEPALQRLAVHFRTSPNGPTLRLVDLHDGAVLLRTFLGGDYSTRDVTSEGYANAWIFPNRVRVGQNSIIRLEIQFPIGFDSAIDPGEFVLLDVTADFPRKGLAIPHTPTETVTDVITKGDRPADPCPTPSAACATAESTSLLLMLK